MITWSTLWPYKLWDSTCLRSLPFLCAGCLCDFQSAARRCFLKALYSTLPPSLCALLSAMWPVKCIGIVLTSVGPLAVSMLSKLALSQEHWPFTTNTCLSLSLCLFHVTAFSLHLLLWQTVCLLLFPSYCLSESDFLSVNLCSYHHTLITIHVSICFLWQSGRHLSVCPSVCLCVTMTLVRFLYVCFHLKSYYRYNEIKFSRTWSDLWPGAAIRTGHKGHIHAARLLGRLPA